MITSSFDRKYRKKVRRDTPAAATIWSTVVCSYPWKASSLSADSVSSSRTSWRLRSARERVTAVILRGVARDTWIPG